MSYADECLERAEKACPGPWGNEGYLLTREENETYLAEVYDKDDLIFIAAARTMVPELAKRLKKSCESLAILKGVIERKMPVHPEYIQELIDELEESLK